jgi:hypothetical protein
MAVEFDMSRLNLKTGHVIKDITKDIAIELVCETKQEAPRGCFGLSNYKISRRIQLRYTPYEIRSIRRIKAEKTKWYFTIEYYKKQTAPLSVAHNRALFDAVHVESFHIPASIKRLAFQCTFSNVTYHEEDPPNSPASPDCL